MIGHLRWLLLIVVVWLGCHGQHREAQRQYRSITAFPGGALVTWMDERNAWSLGRLGPAGKIIWATRLEGEPQLVRGHPALLFAGELVAIRTYRHAEIDRLLLEGISVRAGSHQWSAVLHEGTLPDPAAGIDNHFIGYANADAFFPYLAKVGVYASQLYSVDLAGHRGAGRRLPIREPFALRTLQGEKIVHDRSTRTAVTGRPLQIPFESHGYGCVVEDDYWRLVREPQKWSITSLYDERVPLTLAPDDDTIVLEGCAAYWSKLAMFVRVGALTTIVFIDDGMVSKTIDVGSRIDEWGVTDATPGPDARTRFVPLLVADTNDVSRARLVMIDTEEARVAWDAPADVLDQVFRIGDDWLLVRSPADQRLVYLSGVTGKAHRAVRVRASNTQLVTPKNVDETGVWLVSTGPGAKQPIAKLGATLSIEQGDASFVSDAQGDPILAGIPWD
jgi:hypothetical protein